MFEVKEICDLSKMMLENEKKYRDLQETRKRMRAAADADLKLIP